MARDARLVKHFFSLDSAEKHFDMHEGNEQMSRDSTEFVY